MEYIPQPELQPVGGPFDHVRTTFPTTDSLSGCKFSRPSNDVLDTFPSPETRACCEFRGLVNGVKVHFLLQIHCQVVIF